MFIVTTRVSRFAVFIPLAFYATLMSRLHTLPGLTADGQIYLQIARNIRYGIGLGWQASWVPPLHSIMIAQISRLPGAQELQFAAGIVALLMGALLAIATYFLAAAIFDRTTGVMASIVVSSFPHILDIHGNPEAEITYTALLLVSLSLLLCTIRRTSWMLAILTGASFSLAYMGRSEGFLVMLLSLATLSAIRWIRAHSFIPARLCLIILVSFFITSSPYLYYLKQQYGAIVISPKASYVMIWMKSMVYHDNDKGEGTNDELWGLTPDGKLKWQQPSGIGDLARFLMSHPNKSLKVYLSNLLQEVPGRIPNASGGLHFPQVFPVYVAILAVLASIKRWGEDSDIKKTVLFSPLLILFILPLFTAGWCKYLIPYSPLLIIAMCGGLLLNAEWIATRYVTNHPRNIAYLMVLAVIASLVAHYLYIFSPKPAGPPSGEDNWRSIYTREAHSAARAARQQFGPGRNYMTPVWNKMTYDLDGLWTPRPLAGFDEVLRFAQGEKVDYIVEEVLDQELTNNELRMTGRGLKLAGVYRSPQIAYLVAFYELPR